MSLSILTIISGVYCSFSSKTPSGTNGDALKFPVHHWEIPLGSGNESYFQVVNMYLPYFPEATNTTSEWSPHTVPISGNTSVYIMQLLV